VPDGVSATFGAAVTDRSDYGCGGLRADVLDPADLLTERTVPEDRVDASVEVADGCVDLAQESVEAVRISRASGEESFSMSAIISGMRRRARDAARAKAMPRSSRMPHIWLKRAVR
jgi:hypothetical protein